MRRYGSRFGGADGKDFTGLDEPGPEIEEALEVDEEKASAEAELSAELEQGLSTEELTSEAAGDVAEDSFGDSGTEFLVCQHRSLLMGSMACRGNSEASAMHGECVAQLALLEFTKEGEQRSEEAMAVKTAWREEHDIE